VELVVRVTVLEEEGVAAAVSVAPALVVVGPLDGRESDLAELQPARVASTAQVARIAVDEGSVRMRVLRQRFSFRRRVGAVGTRTLRCFDLRWFQPPHVFGKPA
jgi:hypothetical protein